MHREDPPAARLPPLLPDLWLLQHAQGARSKVLQTMQGVRAQINPCTPAPFSLPSVGGICCAMCGVVALQKSKKKRALPDLSTLGAALDEVAAAGQLPGGVRRKGAGGKGGGVAEGQRQRGASVKTSKARQQIM